MRSIACGVGDRGDRGWGGRIPGRHRIITEQITVELVTDFRDRRAGE